MADSLDSAQNVGGGSIIQPIEEESVRRIVAGQAVSDLASAVKELVDNSLDAGSKSINIRLFNQGLDIVEVSDDGFGVPPESRPFLAQAHATSKIRSFDDIYNSSTSSLGFRGEALFCLSNLSDKLIVATRTAEEALGQKMEFNHDGSLDSKSIVSLPRKVGTTVAVLKLLNSLPVRRADMQRRIVQHRSKLMNLMEGYAIFSLGVRINLMDVVDRKETTLLATTANSHKLDQTISSVLGSKFLASVAPISIDLTSAMDESSPRGEWKLEGFLSKADQNNNGNVKAGQQFFSINGRPVELPKVARTIGDVWRATVAKKKFSCILTLVLPNQEYDVNLSPDKRQVLLTHEGAICDAIQTGVTSFWAIQTEGQFTPSASQSASAPAPNPQKAGIPKIDNMESLAKIQESNRKRALELHAQIPTAPASSNKRPNDNIDAMDVEDSDGDRDHDGQTEAKRIFMRRCKEEQREQRRLNASGAADLYEKEETTKAAPNDDPVQGESPRLRRRGGFVHDISTAKQWERPSSIDKNFKVPEGIEDPSEGEDEDEAEQAGAPAKRPRTGPASPIPAKENEDTSKTNIAQCSSRRVTLSLNNELAEVQHASSTESLPKVNEALSEVNNSSHANPPAAPEGSKDCDKLLWVDAQSRFNKREETNHVREVDVLVQTSVSPKQAYQTPNAAKRTNRPPALNLEQFAFRKEAAGAQPGTDSPACQPPIQQPAVSPEDITTESQSIGSIHEDQNGTKRKSESTRARSQAARSPETDDSGQLERTVVWEEFGGTNRVASVAKLERQRGHERKLRLEECRPGDSETGNAKVSLAKGDFSNMTILGQFNLGFILATDSRCNLWILDQHACDERANFEHLMANTVMHNQQLIAPMPLELDPSEENCIKDNMHIFEANGFRFQYDEMMPPRHRMALTALPHSGARDGRKAVNFGKDDVSALCAILGARSGSVFEEDDMHYDGGAGSGTGADGSGMYGNNAVRRYAGFSQASATGDSADKVITRLPKAVAMFASRACRSSVMIGTALSKKEMEKLVKRLDELNDPWKCAHGRPTLTHIRNLQDELLKDERKAAELISAATVGVNISQEPNDDSS